MELRREFQAEQLRRRDAVRRDVAMAWYVAMLSRQEKLPPLEQLIREGPKQQSLAEQRAALETLSAQMKKPLKLVKAR